MGVKEDRLPRWYFGGVAAAMAASCTHPLDLIKVHQQTQKTPVSMVAVGKRVIRQHGFLALYNGLTASILRQLTYAMTRIALYNEAKRRISMESFGRKVAVATWAGVLGGIVGTPADVVNVRMQTDMKLPPEKRQNYKHALHGLWMVYSREGVGALFSGVVPASARGAAITVGQMSIYDELKTRVLAFGFSDSVQTHLAVSSITGVCTVFLTQPFDVVKTRLMSGMPMGKAIGNLVALGPLAFFKGVTTSSVRIIPTTILLFVFFEQLRQNLGYLPDDAPPVK